MKWPEFCGMVIFPPVSRDKEDYVIAKDSKTRSLLCTVLLTTIIVASSITSIADGTVFYRAMLREGGYATVCRLSVCPSVCDVQVP